MRQGRLIRSAIVVKPSTCWTRARIFAAIGNGFVEDLAWDTMKGRRMQNKGEIWRESKTPAESRAQSEIPASSAWTSCENRGDSVTWALISVTLEDCRPASCYSRPPNGLRMRTPRNV